MLAVCCYLTRFHVLSLCRKVSELENALAAAKLKAETVCSCVLIIRLLSVFSVDSMYSVLFVSLWLWKQKSAVCVVSIVFSLCIHFTLCVSDWHACVTGCLRG